MPNDFFEKINYSASNEDSESERKALKINNLDIVLCISGSGSRSLDLLVDSPLKIISIDFNKAQNFLLELKIAAYKSLDYADFCSFIGLNTSKVRLKTYQKLLPFLSEEAKKYWQKNSKLIQNGILYCGTWERFLAIMQKLSIVRKSLLNRLMAAQSLEEQQNIWQKEWDNWLWRFYLKILSNRFLWVNIIREPGAKIIEKDFDVYQYMKKRMDFMATNFLLKNNHFANLIFKSKYEADSILPHHLKAENFDLIKKNIDKIEIITASLSDYLPYKNNHITAFSLSDFSSYTAINDYKNIWEGIIYAAKHNAKFCERQFLVKRNPEKNNKAIKRNLVLENELNQKDETTIYSFCAGEIHKIEAL